MSFVDVVFVVFLGVVFVLHWLAPRRKVVQNGLLLLASLVFYGWVHPWLVALLLGSALLDYACALGIAARPERGGALLAVSVVGNLAVLAFFKYAGFFVGDVSGLLEGFGLDASTVRIFLPVGLSFYTFQTMAYTIDVWRGQLTARRDLLDYLVFVCFFPQLVAGPVERASHLLPQFEVPRLLHGERVVSGISLATWGAFKKVVVADTLAPYVNVLYEAPDPSFTMVWAAALGFTVQVLADFSGYTDIARGVARMLGIELMENFRHPYLAASPMEFWQRWHISFSTWLRDYVYMPAIFSPWVRRWLTLPGARDLSPSWHTARALTITMLLSGLWHGSTANYLLWGAYYAVLGTVWVAVRDAIPRRVRKQRDWRPLLVPLMFVCTWVGMMIFREPSVARLVGYLSLSPLSGTLDQHLVAAGMVALCVVACVPLWIALAFERYAAPRLQGAPWALPLQTTGWALAALAVAVFHRDATADFIYFQF